MATVLSEEAATPDAYPAAPSGLSADAAALPAALIWARIESWVSRRWTARSVVYVVEGPGEWSPRLSPFTLSTAERWTGAAWETVALDAAPLGYALDAATYRVTGTAGDDSEPPELAQEAYRRLAEYFAGARAEGGAPIVRAQLGEGVDFERAAPTTWVARAIHYSGAADLLRGWRGLR